MKTNTYKVLSDRRCSLARASGDDYRCGVCAHCREATKQREPVDYSPEAYADGDGDRWAPGA